MTTYLPPDILLISLKTSYVYALMMTTYLPPEYFTYKS